MDAKRFEFDLRSLSRLTRRTAVAALLASVLAAVSPAADAMRGRGKGRAVGSNRKRRKAAPNRLRTEAACFPAVNCAPGPGKNLSKCDYAGSTTLRGKNLKGANLGSANLAGADASRANLSGANLGKACLVDADLRGATLNGATNTGGAIFCRTVMPNGSVNDSGCAKGTACCPTCIAAGEACGAGVGGACCDGLACSGGRCGEACDVCPSGCPFDNLQDAIDAAAEGDTIRICPGRYRTVRTRIDKERLSIGGAGNGPGGTILDGEGQGRVLEIDGVTATIRDLTITGGASFIPGQPLGGGIFVSSLDATLERVTIAENENDLSGGGVTVFPSDSTLVMRQCAVTDNRVVGEGDGGGIHSVGRLTLDASRVDGNSVDAGSGGGIFNGLAPITNEPGSVELINGSQVTRNRAEVGGGVLNQGQLAVSGGSTITGNTPDDCFQTITGTGCPA